VWLAGRHPGQVPVDIDKPSNRPATAMVMFALKHVLTLRTPMGRRARRAQLGHGLQLIRNKLADLDAAGVIRVDRITEVRSGRPVSADGTVVDVTTVVWCTGSRPDHSFLDLPLTLADDGLPAHHRGVADETGLYLIGASFQFAAASETIQGLDRDARYVARHLRRDRTAAEPSPALAVAG
jgi:putative flavoprotein involved in K+ transport